jgi:hypothetical protein
MLKSKYFRPLKPRVTKDLEMDVIEPTDYDALGYNQSYVDFEQRFVKYPTLSKEIGKLYESLDTTIRNKLYNISKKHSHDKELVNEISSILSGDLNDILDILMNELVSKDKRFKQIQEYVLNNELSLMEMCFISVMWMRQQIPRTVMYAGPMLNEPNSTIEKINLEGVFTSDSQGYVSDGTMFQRPYLDMIIPYEIGKLMSEKLKDKYFIIMSNRDSELSKNIPLTLEYFLNDMKYKVLTKVFNTYGYSEIEHHEQEYNCPQLFQQCVLMKIIHPRFNDPNSDELFDDVYNTIINIKNSGKITYFST